MMIKKIMQVFVVLFLSLVIFGSGAFMGAQLMAAEKPVIPIPKEMEKELKDHPTVFKDVGSFRVIIVRGAAARLLYEKYKHHNVIIAREEGFILVLDLTELDI